MSNHIADANKMVSDTPRTDELLTAMLDAYGFVHQGNCPQRWVNHARELERELNAANQIIRQQQLLEEDNLRLTAKVAQLYEGAEEQKQRIKRLEEAVDAYRKAYTPDGHISPHDCFATGPKTGNPYQDLFACPGCWAERKAKEAKP